MSTDRHPTGGRGSPAGEASAQAAAPRRPYAPPRILSREPLEAVASICAPSPPFKNPGLCGALFS